MCFLRDVQVRSMEQTVRVAEKNMGELCSLLASYTRKTAKLRDKADQLVAQLFHFSSTEDPELQIGLKILAEDLAMVQDYRQAQVERLETRVVDPLKVYGEVIKNKRTDLKKFSSDLNREQKELQKVDKIRRRNPADRQSIVSFAEVIAQKASTNVQNSIRQLEETITEFQKQKLEGIKSISNLHHQRGVEDELEQEEDDEEETDAEEQEESESDMENSGNSKRQSYASQYVQMHT
ncbi:unnamed protein product [Menidia menidia]|uniref:(Atlantic silverside) hypothetical protein n=1 Tax=Menidia menidia TaxID=238744 RepID=A0A8S4AT18_9TELE|nr:unnamed protein product [Menidia menidia]